MSLARKRVFTVWESALSVSAHETTPTKGNIMHVRPLKDIVIANFGMDLVIVIHARSPIADSKHHNVWWIYCIT